MAALLASSAAARPAAARPAAVVAVFSIQDSRFDRPMPDSVLNELTNYLSVRLAEGGLYRLTPPALVRKALSDAKAESYRPCVDEACQIELGKALAAEKSLGTRIIRVDSQTCAVTSTLYDLKTEVTERAATAEGRCDRDAIADALREVVSKLRVLALGAQSGRPAASKNPRVEALRKRFTKRLNRGLETLDVTVGELESDPEGAAAMGRFKAALLQQNTRSASAALRRALDIASNLKHHPDVLRRRLNGADARVAAAAARLPAPQRAVLEGRYLGLYARINAATGSPALRAAAQVIDEFLAELKRLEARR